MPDKNQLSLAGQTQRWKFTSGPTANATYEHTFNEDGTVVYRGVDGGSKESAGAEKKPDTAPKAQPIKYASFEVAPGLHLVSYLSEHGYTLTVLVNTGNKRLHGFASNEKEWYPLEGTLL